MTKQYYKQTLKTHGLTIAEFLTRNGHGPRNLSKYKDVIPDKYALELELFLKERSLGIKGKIVSVMDYNATSKQDLSKLDKLDKNKEYIIYVVEK